MKNVRLIFGLALGVMTIVFTSDLYAQGRGRMGGQGNGQGLRFNNDVRPFIPGLTDAQKDKIQSIHLENARGNMTLYNQIVEKRAALRTATTQENPDMNRANALLDEISALQTQLEKNRLQCRMTVRQELTNEQKIYFDQSPRWSGMNRKGGFGGNYGGQMYNNRRPFCIR